MSECVVRMENPDDCLKCGVRHICNPYVDYWQQDTRKKPEPGQKGCLIICSLPEGHGRLVDADACASVLKKQENEAVRSAEKLCYGFSAIMFEEANTIVPAEAERSET